MIYPRIVSEFPVQVKVIDCFLYKFFLMVLCERGALLLGHSRGSVWNNNQSVINVKISFTGRTTRFLGDSAHRSPFSVLHVSSRAIHPSIQR